MTMSTYVCTFAHTKQTCCNCIKIHKWLNQTHDLLFITRITKIGTDKDENFALNYIESIKI